MASSGNFMTLNPLKYKASSYTTSKISHGNLRIDEETGNAAQFNFGLKLGDGKFYWELYINDRGGSSQAGVCIGHADLNNYTSGGAIIGNNFESSKILATSSSGNSSTSSYGSDFVATDIIGIAMDFTNSTMEYFKNNSSQGSFSFSGANDGTTYYPYVYCNHGLLYMNAGQDSSFVGQKTSGSANASDENGFGDFYYTPPSGFLALCTANLPISDDIDPAQTSDDYPAKQFNAITYTGNGSTNAITGLGFKPDLVWVKRRNSSGDHRLVDSSRGVGVALRSNVTGGDVSESNGVTAFGTDGFTLGSEGGYNASSDTFIGWCWRANGGTTASNSEGSITSTVQANTKAGFSIATYTSPGSGTNHTVGHGLSGVDFVITKNRDATFNWYCFHSASSDKTYRLNSGSEHSYANWSMGATTWGSENGYTHDGTSKFIAYAWQNVSGMQHFSSYTGNGNSDGPFVYTGFRPRLIFTLLTNSTSGWRVRDTARDTYNPSDTINWWNRSDQEYNSSGYYFDILSNGFKVRTTGSDFNTSGSKYLFGAWGDVPFKYNNTF
jgi:hypothetical protein